MFKTLKNSPTQKSECYWTTTLESKLVVLKYLQKFSELFFKKKRGWNLKLFFVEILYFLRENFVSFYWSKYCYLKKVWVYKEYPDIWNFPRFFLLPNLIGFFHRLMLFKILSHSLVGNNTYRLSSASEVFFFVSCYKLKNKPNNFEEEFHWISKLIDDVRFLG